MNIIKREFLLLINDKGSMFFTAVFPLLLVLLLGNLLEGLNESDYAIGEIKLGYTGDIAAYLPNVDGVNFVHYSDTDKGKTAVSNEEADSFFEFTQNGIELYTGKDKIKSRAAEMIFQSLSLEMAANTPTETINNESSQILPVKTKDLGIKRTMLDYYSVAMVVMIIFMGSSVSGAVAFFEARRDGTLRRMVISPNGRISMYIKSVLSFLPQNVLQALFVMIPMSLIFGVKFANTVVGNVLLLIMFTVAGLAVSALFSLVGLLSKIAPVAIIMPICWAFLFCSGTFSPSVIVSKSLPPYVIQTAAFDLTIFGRSDKVWLVIAVGAAVFIVSSLIGAVMFSRKEVTAR